VVCMGSVAVIRIWEEVQWFVRPSAVICIALYGQDLAHGGRQPFAAVHRLGDARDALEVR
jgi:hypothetical protein